ncbi:50S ribosomal protein L15 [Patescibacteria group bacterium]|nr:50S ribosomal protein L15 [Patescibacteria group bacterium]
MKLHGLKVYRGSRKRRKVVGRGLGSGHGTYSGRGAKGQNARKSGGVRPGFEGGRQPLIRQVPKLRGFRSQKAKAMAVRVGQLNKFNDGDKVTVETLLASRIIRANGPVKILTGGDLKKKLEVLVPVSAGAKAIIEKAGGKVI